MEKRNLDIFERIVQTGEKINEAQKMSIKGNSEPKKEKLEVNIQ